MALKSRLDGDPAWASIYGKEDKLSDVLRDTNFGDGTLNKLSYGAATTLDVTETVCDVINVADMAKNMYKAGPQISETLGIEGKKTVPEANKFGEYSTKIDSKVTVVEKQDLPSWLESTYKDGNYRTVVTNEDIKVYRSFGCNAEAGGAFATSKPAISRVQSKVDSAILPEWKNTLRYEAEILVPKGTTLNIGRVGEQYTMSGARLAGDADQFLLPQNWDLNWIQSIREVKL